MQLIEESPADQSNLVDAARVAIWRLFQEGYVDEDMATAGLLAVDLGTRRAQRKILRGAEPGVAMQRERHPGRGRRSGTDRLRG